MEHNSDGSIGFFWFQEALKCAQRQPGDEGAPDTTTAFFPEDPDVSLVAD